jgi:Mrp family chromosome partitioning ATPase
MSLLASYRASSGENAVAVRSFSDGDDTNDEFRLIKWHFLARAASGEVAGRNPRVLLVTSAARGEGKSYVAHHLAANFALDPHIQLTLIDANFDNPALGSSSWLGGSSGGAGLLDYLESPSMDQSSIIKSTGLGNVRAILSGSARGNAPELLSDARVEHLMGSLTSDANSFVIIDAGPILNGSGAAVLARVAGHIAFVVASNRTSRNQINKALGTLDRIAGPIDEKSLGLIFN